MTEYETLKETQKELGSALACSFKKNGEMLIFVTADADNDEVMKSLIRLTTELSKYRGEIMKPVDQTIVDKGDGDCMQAVLASLFEQKFEDTVNVYDYPEGEWVTPFMNWVENIGYEYEGVMNMFVNPLQRVTRKQALRDLSLMESVGGYFYGAVNSRSFKGVTHAVIIDTLGIVVHDPNPNKAWLGVDTLTTRELLYVYTFSIK